MNDQKQMDEFRIPERIEDLIARYLGAEISPVELYELEGWVDASSRNKKAFLDYKKAWFLAGLHKENHSVDIDRDWSLLRKRLPRETGAKQMESQQMSKIRWLSLAATLAILLGAAWWIFLKPSKQIKEIVAIEGVLEHRLGDGSVVALNRDAKIRYLSDFKTDRKILLEGDAFFDVSRDPDQPFRIATQNLQIEVLGTSFYVDARDGEAKVQVIVQSGKVAFGKDQNRVILEAGETGVYDKNSGHLTQFTTTDQNYLSWKSKTLLFDETPLDQVIFAINRQYRSDILLGDETLQSCKLTATYADQSLESVLRILEKTFNLQVLDQEGQIVLKGEGCN